MVLNVQKKKSPSFRNISEIFTDDLMSETVSNCRDGIEKTRRGQCKESDIGLEVFFF